MAIQKPIGYIICETASSEPAKPQILDVKSGRVRIEAVLQDMNVKNRNGRFYSDKVLKPQLTAERQAELLGANGLPGEAGHPMSKDLLRQQTIVNTNVSHFITKLWTEGDLIKANIRAAHGPVGDMFNAEVLEGLLTAYSLRALGSVVNTSRGAEVQNAKIITWDWVYYPSHKKAYQEKIITEGCTDFTENEKETAFDAGLFVPIMQEKVISYVKDSSQRLRECVESLEFLYESAQVINNGKQVKLVDKEGTQLVINLEQHIEETLMDYCCTYNRKK